MNGDGGDSRSSHKDAAPLLLATDGEGAAAPANFRAATDARSAGPNAASNASADSARACAGAQYGVHHQRNGLPVGPCHVT